ncbi:MAG: hypothetical protein ABIT05_14870 [Chitinophagaceae bacterium]
MRPDYKQQGQQPEPVPVPPECKQDDTNPTQMVINKERNKYCLSLYESKGATSQQEVKYAGEGDIYNDKKCLFNYTEENYRRYRNLEITIGTEMLATTESMKGNVDQLKKWNSDLNAILKKLSKTVKDVKGKFSLLHQAGCLLKSSIYDKCNAAQWKALTGKDKADCGNPTSTHPACTETSRVIEDMICKPIGLSLDIDSICQSSSDVVGIQIFSNIDTLEPLHKDLDLYAKDLEKHVGEVMKTREGDLKTLQQDLVKSVKDITKSAMDRNSMRSDFEGWFDTVNYLCCPPCDCVGPKDPDDPDCQDGLRKQPPKPGDRDCYCDCTPRLKTCEENICIICDEVKQSFCCDPDNPSEPKPRGCCGD